MNIYTSLPAGQPKLSAKTSVESQRKALESALDDERYENEEKFADFDMAPHEYFAREKELDKLDPRVAESKARGWRAAAFAVAGGIAGAQGGNVGGFTAGIATAAATTRGVYQTDEGLVSGLGAGAMFGGIVGLLASVGGTFGAVVGGLIGAVVAANLPNLFSNPD